MITLKQSTNNRSIAMNSNSKSIVTPKGVLFNLRENGEIQKILITSLLTKYNCLTQDIANMLQTNAKKIENVLLEHETLSEKEASDLVRVFYIANPS